jgi:hypothetical protein
MPFMGRQGSGGAGRGQAFMRQGGERRQRLAMLLRQLDPEKRSHLLLRLRNARPEDRAKFLERLAPKSPRAERGPAEGRGARWMGEGRPGRGRGPMGPDGFDRRDFR